MGNEAIRFSVDPTGGTYVDDVSWFPIFDSEIGGCGSDELERGGIVEGDDCVPLFVCHLLWMDRIILAGDRWRIFWFWRLPWMDGRMHTLWMTPSQAKPALFTITAGMSNEF